MTRAQALPGGLYSVMVTPLCASDQVDGGGLERLTGALLDEGVDGLVALAVMGENAALSDDERQQVVARVTHRAEGKVPVVVGVLDPDASRAAALAADAAQRGASALLIAPPRAPTPAGAIEYTRVLAKASGLPLLLLDYPPLGRQPLPVAFIVELVDRVPAVRGIKLEGSPILPRAAELQSRLGDRLRIFGAQGGLHAPQLLARGAHGLMTGYPFAAHLLRIIARAHKADGAGAQAEYARWLPLMVYCGQQGLGVAMRKEILCMRGIIACPRVRPPHHALDDTMRAELTALLKDTVGPALDSIPRRSSMDPGGQTVDAVTDQTARA